MVATTLATLTAFLVATLMVPALHQPARRIGLTDDPCRRKRHNGSIPLTGGLAMFVAVLAALTFHSPFLFDYASLVMGMAVLLAVGLADDLFELRALHRLLVQVMVAGVSVHWSGLDVSQLGQLFGPTVGWVGLGQFSPLFTILSIVFLINVINMTDGVDGLAGGITMLFFALLAVIAWLSASPASLVAMCLIMMAATGGFLVWNMRFPFRSNASAFMGDAGSMMLGFAAAWLAIAVAVMPGDGPRVYPIVIVWVLLVPSMDTIAVTVRRLSRGRSPMAPDRTHLHHIMRRCGLSVTTTVGLIHLSILMTGLFGIIAWQAEVPEWILFTLATALIVGYTLALLSAHRILRWGLRRGRLPYSTPSLRALSRKPDETE